MCIKKGTTINPISATCRPTERICVQPKFSSLVQISFTFIGFISNGSGAILVGENSSFNREPNPPNPSTQPFASLLFIGPLGTGRLLKNSLTLSQKPPPYCVGIKSDFTSPRILTGRSNRNCFRLDQKLSGISIGGRPKFGTADDCAFEPGSSPSGRRGDPKFSIVPGTIPRLALSRY